MKLSRARPGYKGIMIPGEPEDVFRMNAGDAVEVLEETAKMLDEYYAKYAKKN